MNNRPIRRNSQAMNTRQQRMWRRNQNTVNYTSAVAIGPVTNVVLIALMVAVLGMIYLTQVTKLGFYGYELDKQEKTLADLSVKKRDLQVENARLQALSRVSDSSVAKAMTEPASIERAQN